MKQLYAIIFLVLFANMNLSHAIESQSLSGGTGLGMMRTAEVIEPGFSSWFMSTQVDSYNSTTVAGDSAAQIKINFGYIVALGQSAEWGFSVPLTHYTADSLSATPSLSGTGDLRTTLKINFIKATGLNSSSYSVTFFSSMFAGSGDADVSSGEDLYGIDYNVSHYFDGTAVHTNFGYKRDDVFTGALNTPFVDANFITASVGLERVLSNVTSLSLQGIAEVNDETEDKNLLVSTSFLYAISSDLNMTLGAVVGVPDNRSNPKSSVFFSISSSPSDTNKPRKESFLYSISSNAEQASEKRHEELVGKINNVDQRLETIERTLAEHADLTLALSESLKAKPVVKKEKIAVKDNRLHIQILVPIVRPNYNDYLFSFVKKNNYRVTHKNINTLIKKKTYIYYRAGLGKKAVALGHELKGNQVILHKRLPKGVDFQIVAGSELLK